MLHKKEFFSVRTSAVQAFNNTFDVYASGHKPDQIFYILTKKFLNHINSFAVILNGTNFNDISDNTDQVDHASAKVLLRAAFESYLTMSHIFFNDSKLTDYRILLYQYSGLKERIEKLPREDLDPTILEKISKEEETFKQLKDSIFKQGAELNINKKYIKKALSEGWRAGNGWITIGERSSLPKKYVETVYPYLCGYSHSGYELYMQLICDEMLSLEELECKQSSLYFWATFLLAYFCQSYVSFTTNFKSDVELEGLTDVGNFLLKYKNIYPN